MITSAACASRSSAHTIRSASVNFYTGGVSVISRVAFIHPRYDPSTQENNIGLIQAPGLASTRIQLLPRRVNIDLRRQQTTVAGWGLSSTNQQSPVLQFTRGFILDSNDSNCRNNFNNIAQRNVDRLCATFSSQRSCTGDTGSALVIQVNRTNFLVGIAALPAQVETCARSISLFSGITTETRNWITEITNLQWN